MTRDAIVGAARGWIGTPFRHQGRSRRGTDCVGLILCLGHEFGSVDFDTVAYRRRPDGVAFMSLFREHAGPEKPVADARTGDILIFRETSFPCHCGIVAEWRGEPSIIHAHARMRKVVEEPLRNEWPDRRLACFDFPGVDA